MTEATPMPVELSEPIDATRLYTFGGSRDRALLDTPWHRQLLAWARDNGIDPDVTGAIEVWQSAEAGLFAKVSVYELDEQGRKILLPGGEEFAQRAQTFSLSSPPPPPPPISSYRAKMPGTAMRLTRHTAADVAAWVADDGQRDVTLNVPAEDDPDGTLWLDLPTEHGTLRAKALAWVVKDIYGDFSVWAHAKFMRWFDRED